MCDETNTDTETVTEGKLDLYNMTPFQRGFCDSVQERADFKYWIHTRSKPKRLEGKIVMTFMTEDGLKAVWLGRTEVLAESK